VNAKRKANAIWNLTDDSITSISFWRTEMIYNSFFWKEDLRNLKNEICNIKIDTKDEDELCKMCHIANRTILYTATIIRVFLESNRLSDAVDKYIMNVVEYSPIKHIDRMHRWCELDKYNWNNSSKSTRFGKAICNQLLHSYVFSIFFDEDGERIHSFVVASDFDRNKHLLKVELSDWLNYIDYIVDDMIIVQNMHFDEKVDDYVYTKKERGILEWVKI
jgi:protein-arginine kinase activator protein McsA